MLQLMEKYRKKKNTTQSQDLGDSQKPEKTDSKETSVTGTTERKADRILTYLLRGGLAIALSALFSGIPTGYFEAMTGLEIEFGSSEFYFTSLPYAIIAFYLFMKLFDFFNLFESKKFEEG